MAMVYQQPLEIRTRGRGRGTAEIADEVARLVRASRIATGSAHVFVRHTSCSLMITKNADPAERADLDDMAAYVPGMFSGSLVTVPVGKGELLLGARQRIYLWERRTTSHSRKIVVTVTG